jgi:hypothetical protein
MNNPIKSIQELQQTSCTELLMTSVPPPKETQIISINGPFECKIPLRTRHISWPQNTTALCHHCAGSCDRGPPLPAVRYYDSQNQVYWIYGPFCCSSCVFGHICENYNSKQLSATHTVLREYFGIMDVKAGPPRSAHERFGGPLSDADFYNYGPSKQILDELEPPFVTFAHYMIANSTGPVANTYDLLPQSAGQLTNLSRPKERKHPLATKTSTGQSPLLLNYIATLQESKETVAAPRKRKVDTEEATVGYLSRYVKKNVTE